MSTKIAIYVEGGVVQSVFCSDQEAEVELIDRDSEQCEGFTSDQTDDHWRRAIKDLHEVL